MSTENNLSKLDVPEETKRQEVHKGQRILARAASNKSLMGHGTENTHYTEILKAGVLIHSKGGIQYANLEYLAGGGPSSMDIGNGLFVLSPESDRNLEHDDIFVRQEDGTRKISLDHIKWIILPKCEVSLARDKKNDNTFIEQYRDKIVTYEEAAKALGYKEGLNRITEDVQELISQFRKELTETMQDSLGIFTAIEKAQELTKQAAQDGADGIIKAGLALQELARILPDKDRIVRYAKDIHKFELVRINASDKTWFAIVEMIDDITRKYALVFRDERKVDRRIDIDRSRTGTDFDGQPVFE